MKVQEKVLEVEKLLSSRERRIVRDRAKVDTDVQPLQDRPEFGRRQWCSRHYEVAIMQHIASFSCGSALCRRGAGRVAGPYSRSR
jgi:hypothetical protein